MQLNVHHIVFVLTVLALNPLQPSKAQGDFSSDCDVIDVALLIDTSDAVDQEHFEGIRNFITTLIQVLRIGMQNTRLAAVQSWSETQALWTFSDSNEAEELVHVIQSMRYTGGSQLIHQAFGILTSEIFQVNNGDRADVPDAVIIFTGGKASNEVMETMSQLKERQIHVIIVTVGEEIDFNWRNLASDPVESNFFNLDNAFHIVFLLQSPSLANCADNVDEVSTTSSAVEETTQPATTFVPTTTTAAVKSCISGSWTSWYNSDNPEGLGDDESLWSLRARYPGEICDFPNEFEARAADTRIPLNSSVTNVYASHLTGLECLNYIGEACIDYEIRFCCQNGADTDDIFATAKPSAASSTIISASTTTSAPETTTSQGFSSEPEPTCPTGGWTPWYNSDNPQGLGDDESLTRLRARYPDVICNSPISFEARDAETQIPLNSSSTNVVASRFTGLECLNFLGEHCLNYEIRFCCPKGPRCFVGPKVTANVIGQNEQTQKECSPGQLCSDVTATVVTYRAGEIVASTSTIGVCMSSEQCTNATCDTVRNLLPSASTSNLQNCKAKCCQGNLCNQPTVSTSTPPPTPTTTSETITVSQRNGLGTRCYTGFDITGSPPLARYGKNIIGYKVTQCDPEFVCSDLKATPIFRRGLFSGAVVHQSQCLPRVVCGTNNCEYVKSLLPDSLHVNLVNCSVTCCDWDNCNQPRGNVQINTEAPRTTSKAVTRETKGPLRIANKSLNTPSVSNPTPASTPTLIVKLLTATTPSYDEDFLPSCTVSQAVSSMFWCETLVSTPQAYNGVSGCRNKIREISRCVQKQLGRCFRGSNLNLLDDLQFPNLNSQVILQMLQDVQSDNTELSLSINNFCSNEELTFPIPISSSIDGCHPSYLNELRERAKIFFTSYASVQRREDLCRASQDFKRWFVVATYRKCSLTAMDRLGYQTSTIHRLKSFLNAALRTLKNLEPVSCKSLSNTLS